jgi:O-antigen/teichoic acid export membrane protein
VIANEPGETELTPARPVRQMGHTFVTKALIAFGRAVLLVAVVRALTPADFGAYSLVTTNLTFALILVGLNANVLIYRDVPGTPVAHARRIFAAVSLFELSVAAAVLAIAVVSGVFDGILAALHVESYRDAFVLALAWIWVELLCQELMNFLYARQQIGLANVLDLMKQLAWVPIPFVIWALRGSLSVGDLVVSVILGSSAAAVFGLYHVRPRGGPSIEVAGRALLVATPLIVPQLSFYALKLVDRYFLSATRSLDETGVYAFITSIVNLLYSFSALVVANTMTPMAVRAHNEGRRPDRDDIFWRLTKFSLWLFALGAVGVFAVAAFLVPRFRPEYAAAPALVPLVVVGYGLIIVASPPQNVLWLEGRLRVIIAIDVATALVVIATDSLLIPATGAYGAALGTMLGFGLSAYTKQRMSGMASVFRWRELLRPGPALAPVAQVVMRRVQRGAK